jgi:hypothetical protein
MCDHERVYYFILSTEISKVKLNLVFVKDKIHLKKIIIILDESCLLASVLFHLEY